MKKLLYILLGASFLVPQLGSCVRESIPERPQGEMLHLTVEVESLGGKGATRGTASVGGEDTVGSLYLMFFDRTDDRSGQYRGYIAVELPEGESGDKVSGMNVDTDIDFSGTSLSAANAYNILALANIGDNFYVDGTIDSWMSQWSGKRESYVMAQAQSLLPPAFTSDGLPMHGRMEKAATEDQVHLVLSRDVARFDVVMSDNVRYNHDLVKVSIWNAYTSTSVWEQGVMDTSSGTRTRYHYSVENDGNTLEDEEEDENPLLGDIRGGLYAFENQVSAPGDYDELTTCLIVGLKNRSNGKITYYRVNMTGNSGAQNLKRNYAYELTISGVQGPGESTEEIAYLGESNKLIYTIGQWNLDDNGLIVQDEYSVLSIPTKTVTFGKKAQTVELSIHTFSTLPSPAPLVVRSQTYRPASDNITAEIDNNTLVITATELPISETQRNGVIVLSYAGLEISLNVVQSGVHDDYLYVTLPDGGIPSFPAYSGITSGLVTVQATGPWTAKLYLEGFSFNPSTALSPVKTITNTDALVVDDPEDATTKKFRIYTHSYNMGDRERRSFIVVSLDKDPETYSAVISLSQTNVKQIHVQLPRSDNNNAADGDSRTGAAAVFNGAGTGLVAGIDGNSDKFFVVSQKDKDDNFIPWNTLLVMNGYTDDTRHFEIIDDPSQHHISNQNQNYVIVRAKGVNISGREYVATLRVQTDPGTFVDVILTQKPAEWKLPATPAAIPAAGGETVALTLDAFAGMHYTVEIESISGATDHFAYLVDPGEPANKYSKLKSRAATEPFIVGFPKLIYPNLYSPVSAVVKVTSTESGDSKTFTVMQSQPTQKRVDIFNAGLNWGGISNVANKPAFTYTLTNDPDSSADPDTGGWYGWYSGAWARNFHSARNFGNTTEARVNITTIAPGMASASHNNFATVWPEVKETATFIHFTRPGEENNTAGINENTEIWNWITDPAREGVLLVNVEDGAADDERQFMSNRIPGMMGLTGDGIHNDDYVLSSGSSRVMDYIKKGGTGPFSDQTPPGYWRTVGTTSYLDLSSVEAIDQAVPVLVNASGYCAMMIDPKRRIVVKTDSEMTDNQTEMAGALRNVQAWMINTAQYGTHFSEYFWDSPRVLMPIPTEQQ